MIESKRISGIGVTRSFAIILIIICHILQEKGNYLCFFFNIGVQIFLFISGWLYGGKSIDNVWQWYKKRLIRILIPYYVMLSIIVVANVCLGIDQSPFEIISSILCLQWYKYSISNAGHLWYISCILFCYLLTPILQYIMNIIKNMRFRLFIVFGAGLFLQVLELFGALNQSAYMVFTYILGYYLCAFYAEDLFKKNKGFKDLLALLVVVGYVVLAIFKCGFNINIPSPIIAYYKVITAVAIVYLMNATRLLAKMGELKLVKWIDKYSYSMYLCHHIFILGAFSVLNITSCLWINILIAIILILVFSFILEKMSDWINGKIIKKRKVTI